MATLALLSDQHRGGVSIHATLAGGDAICFAAAILHLSFYPRHPRGWRPFLNHHNRLLSEVSIHAAEQAAKSAQFLSTSPSRVATYNKYRGESYRVFLSTPPSRVATDRLQNDDAATKCFYPRHPRGWRPARRRGRSNTAHVSIHATLAGGDLSRSSTPPCR